MVCSTWMASALSPPPTTNQALANADVLALLPDRQGGLWVATRGDGLFRGAHFATRTMTAQPQRGAT
jgi:ligand-binding sensor domain-containing protein